MKKYLTSLILTLVLGGIAQAAINQYYSYDTTAYDTTNSSAKETEFLSQLVNSVTDGFEGCSDGQTSPIDLSFGTLIAPEIDYVIDKDLRPTPPWDPKAVYGTKLFYVDNASSFEIIFNNQQNALGFYAGDVGDGAQTSNPDLVMELTFIDNSTEQVAIDTGPGIDNCFLYWGIISDKAFDKVTIWGDGGDAYWFDQMTVGVPEPATVLMFGLGGILLRRRKK